MSRRRRRRRGGDAPAVNVTSLIDVSLILLIVFIIVAPALTAGVGIELPKTGGDAVAPTGEVLAVDVAADGSVRIAGHAAGTGTALDASFRAAAGGRKDRTVYVRADRRARYETVLDVLARLKAAGLTSINLLSERAGA